MLADVYEASALDAPPRSPIGTCSSATLIDRIVELAAVPT